MLAPLRSGWPCGNLTDPKEREVSGWVGVGLEYEQNLHCSLHDRIMGAEDAGSSLFFFGGGSSQHPAA